MAGPSPQPVVSLADLFKLEEFAHELSNTVGNTMNSLILATTGQRETMFDHLAVATEQAMQATGTLRMLMMEIARLRQTMQSPPS